MLPEGAVHKMGPFLKPLIDEAKMHYVEGFDVRILQDIDINGYTATPGVHQVRFMLLLGTADLKAHQKISYLF